MNARVDLSSASRASAASAPPLPLRFRSQDADIVASLCEHKDEMLAELCGVSATELAELHRTGVI